MWYLWICVCAFFRWETIILISMYGIYIIIMKWAPFSLLLTFPSSWYRATTCFIPTKDTISLCVLLCRFNRSLYSLAERHCSRAGQPCLSSLRRTTAVGSVGDCDNDMVPLKPGAGAHVCTCACVHLKHQKKNFLHLWACSTDLVTQFSFSSPDDFQKAKIELEHFDGHILFPPLFVSPSLCSLCLIKLSTSFHFHLLLTSLHLSPLSPDLSVVPGQDSGVVMVDEMLNLHPHQLSFSEASLRLLITPHFPPFTRLRMAGRMVINEVHCTCSHPSHNVPLFLSARLVGI